MPKTQIGSVYALSFFQQLVPSFQAKESVFIFKHCGQEWTFERVSRNKVKVLKTPDLE